MATRLEQLGFEVTRLENAGLSEMRVAVARLGQRLLASPETNAVVFFAGHGFQSRGINYLMPVDMKQGSEAEARASSLELPMVLRELEQRDDGVNVVILDACRDNPFAPRVRGAQRGLARVQLPATGTLIAYATAPGSVAEDGEGENSVFTAALVEALAQPGLDEVDLFKRVGAIVERRTANQQRPWYEGRLRGDFVFNVPVSDTVQTPVAPVPLLGAETAVELAFWNSIQGSDNAAMFEEYLRQYPDGRFAGLARLQIEALRQPAAAATPAPAPSPAPAPAIAAAGPPAAAPVRPDAAAQQRERIAVLLAAAASDVAALRLTSPASSNAVDRYREVLALDSANAQAMAGLGEVVGKYIQLAEQALARGNRAGAQSYLERAAGVQPGSAAVEIARARLLATSTPAAPQASAAPAEQPAPAGARFPVPEMVRIPGGCYQMGSPATEAELQEHERQHRACLGPFAIAKTEVTVGDFRRFVEATAYQTDAERHAGGQRGCWTYEADKSEYREGRSWRSPGFAQGEDHPVVCVSWNDAQAYVAWLSGETGSTYRLPKEAEWEYAARGGSSSARFWGDNPDGACSYANVYDRTGKRVNRFDWTHHDCDDKVAQTAPVGRFQANGSGLHDMLGNVWEWTCSEYRKSYDGEEMLCAAESSAGQRVLRGGSWNGRPQGVRSAARFGGERALRNGGGGFRLAQD